MTSTDDRFERPDREDRFHDNAPPSRPALSLIAGGWVVLVIGLLGVFGHISHFTGSIPWFQWAKWIVLLALLHDLVIAPFVSLVAFLISRFAPPAVRAWVAIAAIVSGPVILISLPAVRGYGRLGNNPSILPGNYARGLAITLGWVWGLAILGVIVTAVRTRRAD